MSLSDSSTSDVSPSARRVPPDPSIDVDYADCFEVAVAARDERTMEEWLRAGLERAPVAVRWTIVLAHRGVLGLRLAPVSSPEHILGWTIVENRPDLVRVEASSWFMRAAIVGHRIDESHVRLTTVGDFLHPVPGRLIWSVVGPVHRRIAPYLLQRAAARQG